MSDPTALHLDHLLYFVPSLSEARMQFALKTGVTPAVGGAHSGLGTHNALASLGNGAYFELLAFDPSHTGKRPEGPSFKLRDGKAQLTAIILRSTDLEALAWKLAPTISPLGDVHDGARKLPDGTDLKWKICRVRANELPAKADTRLLPYVIQWLEGNHPALTSPMGCELKRVHAVDPYAGRYHDIYRNLGFALDIDEGSESRISASIETPLGMREF